MEGYAQTQPSSFSAAALTEPDQLSSVENFCTGFRNANRKVNVDTFILVQVLKK